MKKNYLLIGCLVFPILAVIAFFIGLKSAHEQSQLFQASQEQFLAATSIQPAWLMITTKSNYSFMGNKTASVDEICTKIKEAAMDKNVKGIFINPTFVQIRTCPVSMKLV